MYGLDRAYVQRILASKHSQDERRRQSKRLKLPIHIQSEVAVGQVGVSQARSWSQDPIQPA